LRYAKPLRSASFAKLHRHVQALYATIRLISFKDIAALLRWQGNSS